MFTSTSKIKNKNIKIIFNKFINISGFLYLNNNLDKNQIIIYSIIMKNQISAKNFLLVDTSRATISLNLGSFYV